jgi:hypothetical protein
MSRKVHVAAIQPEAHPALYAGIISCGGSFLTNRSSAFSFVHFGLFTGLSLLPP